MLKWSALIRFWMSEDLGGIGKNASPISRKKALGISSRLPIYTMLAPITLITSPFLRIDLKPYKAITTTTIM